MPILRTNHRRSRSPGGYRTRHRSGEGFTVYGDEITFGGGKVIRDGMGQSSTATRESKQGALDLVITNALIIDHWGIVKADIGIRDGRIVKIGKAGNPDTQDGVDPELVVGAATEVIAARRQNRHGGCDRCAHSLHFAAADLRSAFERDHDDDRRRNRPGYRNQRDHLHARPLESGANAARRPKPGR